MILNRADDWEPVSGRDLGKYRSSIIMACHGDTREPATHSPCLLHGMQGAMVPSYAVCTAGAGCRSHPAWPQVSQ